MKIGVVGAGGVGGYYGARLALAGSEVGLIARGDHLAAIREHGLRIRADDGDFTVRVAASDDPADIGSCDAVLFCVKSYDTDQAAALLGPLLKPETGVVSLQNGVDNEEKIAARIGPEHVLGGASFILAHIVEPGVVEQVHSVQRIIFGELDGSRTERVARLLAEFRKAEIDSDIADDIRVVLWDKFAFLCALAGLTAVTRLPIDKLLAVPETRELFRRDLGARLLLLPPPRPRDRAPARARRPPRRADAACRSPRDPCPGQRDELLAPQAVGTCAKV